MGHKTISFSLSEKSINRAIREFEEYRKELIRKCNELTRQLIDYGYEFAKFEVLRMGAFDTGELADSIQGYFDPDVGVGFIRAECWYAVYVEYGTGVVGSREPHPEAGEHGWVYDVNHHGDSGWVYFNEREGMVMRTKGQPSHPFMYNTFRELQKKAHELAASIFRYRVGERMSENVVYPVLNDFETDIFDAVCTYPPLAEKIPAGNLRSEYTPVCDSFPLMTLVRMDSYPDWRHESTSDEEDLTIDTYEAHIYARSMEECKEIANIVGERMRQMNFRRLTMRSVLNGNDVTVSQIVMRFEHRIDSIGRMYR